MRGERIFMNIAVIIVGIILSCLTFALAITVIIAKQKKKSAYLQKKKSAYFENKSLMEMSSMRIGMENFNQQPNNQRYWLS